MKKFFLALILGVFLAPMTFAYVTGPSNPPQSNHETEYRHVKKSTTAGVSDAVSKGDILVLDTVNNNDGYTVTRVGANNVATASKIVCIASKAIATGDTGIVRCQSKGYVDFLKFDATTATILPGMKLCTNSVGAAVPCTGCTVDPTDSVNNCRLGTATQNSPIVSLESKTGTGTNLKATIQAR